MTIEEIKKQIINRGANALEMYNIEKTDWYLSEWLNDVKILNDMFDMDYETAYDLIWTRREEQNKELEKRIYKEACKA